MAGPDTAPPLSYYANESHGVSVMMVDQLFSLPMDQRQSHFCAASEEPGLSQQRDDTIHAVEWRLICAIAAGHHDDEINSGRLFIDRTPDGLAVTAREAAFKRAQELGVELVVII